MSIYVPDSSEQDIPLSQNQIADLADLLVRRKGLVMEKGLTVYRATLCGERDGDYYTATIDTSFGKYTDTLPRDLVLETLGQLFDELFYPV